MKYPREQVEYDKFLRRWRDHEERRSPCGWAGEEVAGVCLELLHDDLWGLLRKYAKKRKLSEGAVRVLQQRADELSRALPHLGGDAAIYFAEIHELATAVLKLARRDAPND